MRIGIIGTGNVGMSLGSSLVRGGHDVIYGSRDDGRTAPHAGALLGSIRGAVIDAEVVVLATPFDAVGSALAAAQDFAGKILVDATNPIGPNMTLAVGGATSGAEKIAGLAKNARVVKGFNTTGYDIMANPKFGSHRATMFVCGDDDEATKTVAGLANDIGFDGVALAGLARARDLEPMAMVWIDQAMVRGLGRNVAFALARRDSAGASADATLNLTAQPGVLLSGVAHVITIVGTGNIGGGLARAWIRAGHDVRLAVRDPLAPDVVDLVEQGAKVVGIDGAAKGSDVVVLAIPAAAVPETIPKLGDLAGLVVVDCSNGIRVTHPTHAPEGRVVGEGLVMTAPEGSSMPEQVALMAKGARVVRAFNQQGAETLRDARFADLRALSFVAGDDDHARKLVLGLSNDIGLDSIDAGPLAASRHLDHLTLVWLAASKAAASREIGLTLLRR